MLKKNISFAITLVGSFFISVATCSAFGSFGSDVNNLCAPQQPYTGSCSLCHTGGYSSSTPAKTAYSAGGTTLTDYFCPSGPTCTDDDGDTFAIEGGECGPMDCNDADVAVNPSAAENCTDGIDNDCDGLIDAADPDAVGCPPVCTDVDGDGFAIEGGACGQTDCNDGDSTVNPSAAEICDDGVDNNCDGMIDENCVTQPTCTDSDGDGFALEGGECGAVDCDDTDSSVNPDAAENCTDGIDNNCNGLVDAVDDTAVNCPPICSDADGDDYALEGGVCGPVDCDDNDIDVNPGAVEICDDGIDNDCDELIDEGCDTTCTDLDGDGFTDAACGGTDCNDSDSAINPGASEVCGNGVDENCNGENDDVCVTCPEGGVLIIKKAEYKFEAGKLEVKGRSNINTLITVVDAETGNVLAEDVKVKGGKWKVKIKRLNANDAPVIVEAINSEGCSTEREVKVDGRPERKKDRDDDDDDDDDHHKKGDDDDDDDDDHHQKGDDDDDDD
ncbi:MAG: putative metal-binding motif-containing protein [Desulfobulbaceae bacterium]|nr:putative metal-binding motif-containing protein [Desulfobulbaceae bacterium]